jgi:hypothetical protein
VPYRQALRAGLQSACPPGQSHSPIERPRIKLALNGVNLGLSFLAPYRRQVLRKKAGLILISSGLLPTSALETFVKRVDRSKSQFGRGVYVGDTGLELQKILPGSLLIEFGIGLVAHADKHS